MQCDCVSMSSLICFGSYDSKCDCFTGSEILCEWSSCDRHGLKEWCDEIVNLLSYKIAPQVLMPRGSHAAIASG